MSRIYLDHAATTPVLPEAREAMARALDLWANPTSPHGEGRAARAALEEARQTIAEALGWRHDVIFTSGASEAVAIAAKRAKAPGRAYGATEHDIVPASMGEGATVLPVGSDGLIDMAALDAVLAEGPALVAIQQVNNETGVIQPIDGDRRAGPGRGVLAARRLRAARRQAAAAATPTSSPSPRTSSAARRGSAPCWSGTRHARAPSGGQEKGYRRGTQNLPGGDGHGGGAGIARLRRRPCRAWPSCARRLDDGVKAAGGMVIAEDSERGRRRSAPSPCRAAPEQRTAGPVRPRRHRGVGGQRLLERGDEGEPGAEGDAGRSCASRRAVIRVSFGPSTSEADVDALPRRMAADRRACRPAGGMIYLDYQATTPVAPEVAEAMRPWIEEKFANPHSPSRWGREAAAAIEVAREPGRAAHFPAGTLAFTRARPRR